METQDRFAELKWRVERRCLVSVRGGELPRIGLHFSEAVHDHESVASNNESISVGMDVQF